MALNSTRLFAMRSIFDLQKEVNMTRKWLMGLLMLTASGASMSSAELFPAKTDAQTQPEAQLQFTPSNPVAGAAVSLTITGLWPDNCVPVTAGLEFMTPSESSGDITSVPSLLRVLLRLPSTFQACLPTPTRYMLQLDNVEFASGDYRVELISTFGSTQTERNRGSTNMRVASADQAISAFPLTGTWYERQSSGSGLMLTQLRQARRDLVFGTWHNYRSNGSPSWFALQGGKWETPTRYRGDVYELASEPFAVCRAVGCGVVLKASVSNRISLIGRYLINMRSATRAELLFEALPGQATAPSRVIDLEKLL
jgi:hypothetical protein